jgi:hypothetical protein
MALTLGETMKKLISLTLVLLSMSISVSSNAEDFEITVCNLQTHSDSDQAYLEPCGGWPSKNGCNSTWLSWDMATFQGATMYSTALAALIANKRIKVRMDGSTCNILNQDVTTMIRISNQS